MKRGGRSPTLPRGATKTGVQNNLHRLPLADQGNFLVSGGRRNGKTIRSPEWKV